MENSDNQSVIDWNSYDSIDALIIESNYKKYIKSRG